MLRRAFITAGLAGSVALGALMAPGAAQAQEYTLRVHQFLPPQGTVPADFIIPWAEQVTEASGGRLNVEVYSAMALGGTPPSLFDQAREGVVDIVWTLPGYTPGRFPISEVFELPFMMTNAEATSRAAWRFFEEYMQEEVGDEIHMIAVHVHGPGQLHMNAPAVETIADMEGRTVRGPTRIITRMLETMGASAVGMPVPQVPESLQRGVIDGAVIPWEVTAVLRVPELVDTHTEMGGDMGLYTSFFYFAMNREAYEELPEDLRAIIDEYSGIEASAWAGRIQQEGDAPARQAAVDRGNTIITVEGDALNEWMELGDRVRAAWVEEMNDRGHDGQALLDAAIALIEEETNR